MKTYLILSTSPEFCLEKITAFKNNYAVADVDTFPIKPETSIGIAQVRQTLAKMKNLPLSGETKMLIIESMDKATVEAQNALLKILEEAPESTVIVMTALNEKQLMSAQKGHLQIANSLRRSLQARKFLEGNVNYKLVIDIFLLGFPQER